MSNALYLFYYGNRNQVGDVNKDDLPGPEALEQPGKKDQDVKMVRVGDTVEAHQVCTLCYRSPAAKCGV